LRYGIRVGRDLRGGVIALSGADGRVFETTGHADFDWVV
jgi:hypothetical protein